MYYLCVPIDTLKQTMCCSMSPVFIPYLFLIWKKGIPKDLGIVLVVHEKYNCGGNDFLRYLQVRKTCKDNIFFFPTHLLVCLKTTRKTFFHEYFIDILCNL